MHTDIEKYLANCRSEINKVYQLSKQGKPNAELKAKTEGFVSAGVVLGIISAPQAQEMMENIHFEVFGETVAERKQRKASFAEMKLTDPDGYFELPAITRKG